MQNRIPAIERQSLADQAAFQSKQLQQLLAYLKEKSPYYKRVFSTVGVDSSAIKSIDDLVMLPTTDKEDIQRHNWDFLCVPKAEVREYTSTSGTLGKPVTIALNEHDRNRLAYNEMLSFRHMELQEDDIVQLMLTMDRQFMAGMAYYSGLSRIGASVIRSGPGLPEMQWEWINRLQSTVLVSVPSFLLKMLAGVSERDLKSCSVKKILAIGESLEDEHLHANALLNSIQKKWDVQIFSTYASTEMQTAFTACKAHKGGHHHPELIIVELLDEQGFPVKKGEPGEVTITTLGVQAMPLLRYRTGDICKAYYEPCSCGRTTLRLGPVLARKKQMIKYKGTSVYPSSIIDVVLQMEEISEYVLCISKDDMGQDQLRFYLSTCGAREEVTHVLRAAFQQKLRVVPEICFLSEVEIKAMQYPNGSRKPLKIQDSRA